MKAVAITIHRLASIVVAAAVVAILLGGSLSGAVADDGLIQFVQQTPLPPRSSVVQPRRIPPVETSPPPRPTVRRRFDPTRAAARTNLRNTAAGRRLARTPEMFGDFFGPAISIAFGESVLMRKSPVPGGGIAKIADNNKAAISRRCYVTYNHFHNANEGIQPAFTRPINDRPHIDRFTFGMELPLGESPWSAELRVPVIASLDIERRGFFTYDVGTSGNMAMILKRELHRTNEGVLSLGLGTSLPTGGDIAMAADTASVSIRNEAVHLLPFAAVQRVYGDWFFHGFAQLDINANGNTVIGDHAITLQGVVDDQTLLFVDVGIGHWLYRNEDAGWLTGLAGLLECHYETALENADIVDLAVGSGLNTTVGNTINRFDVVHLTAAIQATIDPHTVLRVGGVLPLTTRDDRFFDAEVAVQVILR